MEKGEVAILENLEELLPGRLLELLVVIAEIEAKNSAPLPFGPNDRRASPALFGPATDLIVISGRGGLAHGFAPWKLRSPTQRQRFVSVPGSAGASCERARLARAQPDRGKPCDPMRRGVRLCASGIAPRERRANERALRTRSLTAANPAVRCGVA
jgi:hypothetical protein